jgi:hypothetical protein
MTKSDTESGFVLVEAVAALTIASLAATALIASLIATSSRSAEAGIRSAALREARLLLAETVHAPVPEDLPIKGEAEAARLTWRRTVGETDVNFPGLQKVTVEVDWQSASRKGTTRLEAYRPSND